MKIRLRDVCRATGRWSFVLLATSMLLGSGARFAWATDSTVEQGALLYEQSKFDEAITLLTRAIASGMLPSPDVQKAREIVARCYAKTGRRVEAKEMFKTILDSDPAYRPDPVRTPPDEVEIFNQALKQYEAEQIEKGKRIPASIAFHGGYGLSSNKDFSNVVKAGGGDKFGGGGEFGVSVRFPLRPRLSMDLEESRFRVTSSDSFPGSSKTKYEITALPAVASLYWSWIAKPKVRVNLFAGAGPMLASQVLIKINFFTVPLSLASSKVGLYAHGGAEGEYLLTPRFALTGRVLGRYARAGHMDFGNEDLEVYGTTPPTKLSGRDIDFSGLAVLAGIRAYIGY